MNREQNIPEHSMFPSQTWDTLVFYTHLHYMIMMPGLGCVHLLCHVWCASSGVRHRQAWDLRSTAGVPVAARTGGCAVCLPPERSWARRRCSATRERSGSRSPQTQTSHWPGRHRKMMLLHIKRSDPSICIFFSLSLAKSILSLLLVLEAASKLWARGFMWCWMYRSFSTCKSLWWRLMLMITSRLCWPMDLPSEWPCPLGNR